MTRAEAIRQVLEDLRVIDPSDEPEAADERTVGRRFDQQRARLSEIGLCWWDADAMPDAVAGAFCALVASASASAFNKQYDATKAQSAIAAVKSSERREPVRTDYF